jgi:hypothetical protein
MRDRRKSKLAVILGRAPVVLLGGVLATSAAQTSCGGVVAMDIENLDGGLNTDAARVDAQEDAPSEDSPADRADGMSYGDGYGPTDAREDNDSGGP